MDAKGSAHTALFCILCRKFWFYAARFLRPGLVWLLPKPQYVVNRNFVCGSQGINMFELISKVSRVTVQSFLGVESVSKRKTGHSDVSGASHYIINELPQHNIKNSFVWRKLLLHV